MHRLKAQIRCHEPVDVHLNDSFSGYLDDIARALTARNAQASIHEHRTPSHHQIILPGQPVFLPKGAAAFAHSVSTPPRTITESGWYQGQLTPDGQILLTRVAAPGST